MSEYTASPATLKLIRKWLRESARLQNQLQEIQSKVNQIMLDEMERLDITPSWTFDPSTGVFTKPKDTQEVKNITK